MDPTDIISYRDNAKEDCLDDHFFGWAVNKIHDDLGPGIFQKISVGGPKFN
jgi:hypothetical protein